LCSFKSLRYEKLLRKFSAEVRRGLTHAEIHRVCFRLLSGTQRVFPLCFSQRLKILLVTDLPNRERISSWLRISWYEKLLRKFSAEVRRGLTHAEIHRVCFRLLRGTQRVFPLCFSQRLKILPGYRFTQSRKDFFMAPDFVVRKVTSKF
jgi:hypothetical protein